MKHFIHVKKKALKDDVCKSLIDWFEESEDLQYRGMLGKRGETIEDDENKDSIDITFHPGYLKQKKIGPLLNDYVMPTLFQDIDDYYRYFYMTMDKMDRVEVAKFFNMQKYEPGGGYKQFHSERSSTQFFNRTHAWMIYLNDVDVGGETEFYYQQHFERAEMGKLVIWPADFTYLHRGIIAPYETKYILTGWLEYENSTDCVDRDGVERNIIYDPSSRRIVLLDMESEKDGYSKNRDKFSYED